MMKYRERQGLTQIKKAKVYIKDPSAAPEGSNVKRGPRGGYYYEERSGLKRKEEEELKRPDVEKEKIPENYDEVYSQTLEGLGISKSNRGFGRLKHNFKLCFSERGKQNNAPELLIERIRMLKDKGVKGEEAVSWMVANLENWADFSGDEFDLMAKHFISRGKLKPYKPGITVGWFDEEISEEEYNGFSIIYEQTQNRLKKEYPSGKVVLYRGVGKAAYQKWSKEKPSRFNTTGKKLSSWTMKKEKAEHYASKKTIIRMNEMERTEPSSGIVLKIEVPIERIFTSALSDSTLSMRAEREFVLIGKGKEEVNVDGHFIDGKKQ